MVKNLIFLKAHTTAKVRNRQDMEEQKYIQERQRRAMRSKVTGIVLTVSLHGLLLASCFYTGFTYLDPPPPEKEQILIEFDPVEVEKPKQVWNGTQPRVVEPKPEEPEAKPEEETEETEE